MAPCGFVRTVDAGPATRTMSHGSRVTNLFFSPDGRYLVTTSGDAASMFPGIEPIIRIWDASNGDSIYSAAARRFPARLQPPQGGPMDAWRIAASFFSADGQMLNAVTVGGILASIDLRPDLRSNQERQREVDVRSVLALIPRDACH